MKQWNELNAMHNFFIYHFFAWIFYWMIFITITWKSSCKSGYRCFINAWHFIFGITDGKNFLHVHPMFLHSNATSHKWVFGGMSANMVICFISCSLFWWIQVAAVCKFYNFHLFIPVCSCCGAAWQCCGWGDFSFWFSKLSILLFWFLMWFCIIVTLQFGCKYFDSDF